MPRKTKRAKRASKARQAETLPTRDEILRSQFSYALNIFPEDVPVRGNALVSGDDTQDKEVEDAIIARLDQGDTWAWCIVRVTARHGAYPGMEGDDTLGACSYQDEKEFIQPGGYFDDMKQQAGDRLLAEINAETDRLRYIDAARKLYGSDDVEIDDDAKLSTVEEHRQDLGGAWVSAWVWVSADEIKTR